MKGKRVYIAGALSTLPPTEMENRTPSKVVTDYIANISTMCKIAGEVRKLGFYPYVPGLDFLLGAVNGDWDEEMYREIGMSFLEVCDYVLITSWSLGVKEEVNRADTLGIPVYHYLAELAESASYLRVKK